MTARTKRRGIRGWIDKQAFDPDILGVFINPIYLVRRGLQKQLSLWSSSIGGRLLDIGCGNKPYQGIFPNVTEHIGMEHEALKERFGGAADVFYDGKTFPFPDAHFDSILATEVLEHVFNPDEFLAETNRVLKPGGSIIVTCPFMWMEHQQPHDFARYSSFGVRHLLTSHGFEIIEARKSVRGVTALFQVLGSYLRSVIPFRNYYLRVLAYVIFIAPFTLLGILFSPFASTDTPLYVDNLILARKQ